jgi:hypothetical protein
MLTALALAFWLIALASLLVTEPPATAEILFDRRLITAWRPVADPPALWAETLLTADRMCEISEARETSLAEATLPTENA